MVPCRMPVKAEPAAWKAIKASSNSGIDVSLIREGGSSVVKITRLSPASRAARESAGIELCVTLNAIHELASESKFANWSLASKSIVAKSRTFNRPLYRAVRERNFFFAAAASSVASVTEDHIVCSSLKVERVRVQSEVRVKYMLSICCHL